MQILTAATNWIIKIYFLDAYCLTTNQDREMAEPRQRLNVSAQCFAPMKIFRDISATKMRNISYNISIQIYSSICRITSMKPFLRIHRL